MIVSQGRNANVFPNKTAYNNKFLLIKRQQYAHKKKCPASTKKHFYTLYMYIYHVPNDNNSLHFRFLLRTFSIWTA